MATKQRRFVLVALTMTIVVLSGLIAWREYLSLEPEDVALAWSPDGQQLAFTCRRRRRSEEWRFSHRYSGPYGGLDSSHWYEVCVVKVGSGKRIRLTRNAHYDGSPTWSPNGFQLAYTSRPSGQDNYDVRVLTLGDLASTRLGAGGEPRGRPRWSPVGQQLAFVATPKNMPYSDRLRNLYLLALDTEETTQLTYEQSVNEFAWHPNGRHIVFVAGGYEDKEIFVVSLEMGTISQLTATSGSKASPIWSPDGRRVAFTAGSRLSQVYSVDVLTLEITPLSTDAASLYQLPVWSPDGRSLAYIRNTYETHQRMFLEIQDLDGQGEIRSYEISTCTVLDLQWSPDGKYLALNQCEDWNRDGWNEFKILLFDIEQGVLKPLYMTFPWRSVRQSLSNALDR